MIPTERFEQVQLESLDELSTRLAANRACDDGVWLVQFKKKRAGSLHHRLSPAAKQVMPLCGGANFERFEGENVR